MIQTQESKLTINQERTYRADYYDKLGKPCTLVVTVQHDDNCGNGHNTFAITADLYGRGRQPGEPTIKHEPTGKALWLNSCGCLHDEIKEHLPQLAQYIKWHTCSTDGPMHYIANTLYHAGESNFAAARRSAIWPEATEKQLQSKKLLMERLPALMEDFKVAVRSLELEY